MKTDSGPWVGQRRQHPPPCARDPSPQRGRRGALGRPPSSAPPSPRSPDPDSQTRVGPWFSGYLAGLPGNPLISAGRARAREPPLRRPRAPLSSGLAPKEIQTFSDQLRAQGPWGLGEMRDRKKEGYKGGREKKSGRERKAILPFCKADSREFICII